MNKQIITIAVALAVVGPPTWAAAQVGRKEAAERKLDLRLAMGDTEEFAAVFFSSDGVHTDPLSPGQAESRLSSSNFKPLELDALSTQRDGGFRGVYRFTEVDRMNGGLSYVVNQLQGRQVTGAYFRGPLSAFKALRDNEGVLVEIPDRVRYRSAPVPREEPTGDAGAYPEILQSTSGASK